MERNTIDQTIRNLRERQFEAFFAENKEKAISLIEELVPQGSSVACGGSETLREIGFNEKFRDRFRFLAG